MPNVRYIIREGLSGFRRTKLATTGSILTVAIALLLLGLFHVVSSNTARLISGIKAKIELEVFLVEPASRERIAGIERELLAIDGVERVKFISKEEAARIFREEFGEDILRVLEFNPLPPSFTVYLREESRTAEKTKEVDAQIRLINGTDTVLYRKELLEFIERRTETLNMVALGLGSILAISAIFLIANTIRLTIDAKRKMIQTMKLVGASRWFVRSPFLLEGMVQGTLGGVIAAAIIYYLVSTAAGLVSRELTEFVRVDPVFYGVMMAGGAILGLFGSLLSVRRYIGETVAG